MKASDDNREKPPSDVTEVLVTFHPQIWRNERAVTSDEKEQFIVPIEDATDDDGYLLEDNTGESDWLRRHENAPERARNWYGPYYVTIDELLIDGESRAEYRREANKRLDSFDKDSQSGEE